MTAWPTMTMLRGTVVAHDGAFLGVPGAGRRMARKLDDAIRTGSRFV